LEQLLWGRLQHLLLLLMLLWLLLLWCRPSYLLLLLQILVDLLSVLNSS
jgi:hypothetical protein